jgi:hypothetical protein
MDLTIEDARADVQATRRQISETADQLSTQVHERVAEVKRQVNPLEYVREYPWASLAIATGIGLGISLARADRKAAKAAVRGAKAAGGAIASGAVELKDRAVDMVQQHGEAAAEAPAAGEPSVVGRVREQLQSSVHALLSHGLDELMRELRPR